MIRTTGLTKRYKSGHRLALRSEHRTAMVFGVVDLDLVVEAGEVFGFLGPNGAGKTTTIRLLLDLIRPTSGHIEVFGLDVRSNSREIRRRVGYLPGELSLYERMTGVQLLEHLSTLRAGEPDAFRSSVYELAERLSVDLSVPLGTLSKGNKQKLGVVQAFMHRPDLLVLDEPTSGLDPIAQATVHELIAEVRARGRTVFLSSHVLSEVERIADRVGIIRSGRLVATERVGELKARSVHRLEATLDRPVPPGFFEGLDGVRSAHIDGTHLKLELTPPMDAVVKALARFAVDDLSVREPDLEEIFLNYYSDGAGSTTPVGARRSEPELEPVGGAR